MIHPQNSPLSQTKEEQREENNGQDKLEKQGKNPRGEESWRKGIIFNTDLWILQAKLKVMCFKNAPWTGHTSSHCIMPWCLLHSQWNINKSIEKWPVELGCWSVTAHHRVEKKTPRSSDSSALHVTSVPIEESRHRRCLRTKNTLHDKSHVHGKRKELCQWRYGRMKRN